MGLALAIVIGFFGVVGITHQEALAHKHLSEIQNQKQAQNKKKQLKRQVIKPQRLTARLDGLEVRNLKG